MTGQAQAYGDVQLHIAGKWCGGSAGATIPILNPATGETIGVLAKAELADLSRAAEAAAKGFEIWKRQPAFERYKILRKAADLLRTRVEAIARNLTLEQGKPLAEARAEAQAAGDIVDWFAEEARRTYGRVIPARVAGVQQCVVKEPVGVVAAFTPWNFPINQAVRKVSAALAAGCAIILKGPEETPASCAALVQAYIDAGVPDGVVQLLFGVPSEISEYLIAHPAVRKITFTGSTPVGKHLAMLAGQHMKRITMELGGHSPVIVCEDADLEQAVQRLSAAKFRNAGQICTSPTRFLVHDKVYDAFLDSFTSAAKRLKLGDGLDPDTSMGPLANDRRIQAMEMFVADAAEQGASIVTGGKRAGNRGNFFEPTVLTGVPIEARIMSEEPFGPVVPIMRYDDLDSALLEANRLSYGLAAYAYTQSAANIAKLSAGFESGMVSVNHHGLALPEAPFGGVKDSGYGSEGGTEAMEAYLNTKFVTVALS
ncbi:MAG TPA: NAD-dependent succinate-semialdehyde dehydrogenase [Xanthobacteraceae bacterium]|nr:NAD-dependent succinate-semialdehyde dehydrogenase [Xanthobacteraceae bacterium]